MTSRDPHSWMWAEALGLLERADRLHRQFFGLASGAKAGGAPCWEPPVDVMESANEVIVMVALPGVEQEAIEIRFHAEGWCEIRAERPSCMADRITGVRRLEIPYGRFERRIALPAGHYELVEQSSRNGCLLLRLRKQ